MATALPTAATVTGLRVGAAAVSCISIAMQALSGIRDNVWWYRMPATTTIMFWLGEEKLGDHLDVAARCGANFDKYRGDWDCDVTFDDGRHMSMYAMEWECSPDTPLCDELGGQPTEVNGSLDFASGAFASRITHPTGETVSLQGHYPEHVRAAAWERWSKACLTK